MELKEGAKKTQDCVACKAECCRHVALPIDSPTCKQDYDNIRWYLMHQDVKVFIDDEGDYFLEFRAKCKRLTGGYLCGEYEGRPKICRDYPAEDELCEWEADEEPYETIFHDACEFEAYLEKKGIDWRFKRLK